MNTATSPGNAPADLDRLIRPAQLALGLWIGLSLTPAKAPKRPPNSYQLKHVFERDARVYVTNGEFKGAMLAAGHEPIDSAALNWEYRVAASCRCQRRDGDRYRLCRKHADAASLRRLAILLSEVRR